jgi:hypothetical protein
VEDVRDISGAAAEALQASKSSAFSSAAPAAVLSKMHQVSLDEDAAPSRGFSVRRNAPSYAE